MVEFLRFFGVSAICAVGWPLIAYLYSDWEDPEEGDPSCRLWAILGAIILAVLLWSMATGNSFSFVFAATALLFGGIAFGAKVFFATLKDIYLEEDGPPPPSRPSELQKFLHVCFTWWYPELRAIRSLASIDRLSIVAFIGAEVDMVLLVAAWYAWWQLAIGLALMHLVITCIYHWLNEPEFEEE